MYGRERKKGLDRQERPTRKGGEVSQDASICQGNRTCFEDLVLGTLILDLIKQPSSKSCFHTFESTAKQMSSVWHVGIFALKNRESESLKPV